MVKHQCSIKTLPEDAKFKAAERARAINPANAPDDHAILPNERLTLLTSSYWGIGGVHLTVGFLDNPEPALRARILSHMNAWGEFCNVQFTETTGTAQVRIARNEDKEDGEEPEEGEEGGYWSYLGTDILGIDANKPTMNLAGFTMDTPDSEFYRVVRHETGHTLGFPHEHFRQEIIDRIDREKAIAYFKKNDKWDAEETTTQVLTPLEPSSFIATAVADELSIMCYDLPASITKDGVAVPGGNDINARDAEFAARLYPKPHDPPIDDKATKHRT